MKNVWLEGGGGGGAISELEVNSERSVCVWGGWGKCL